MKLNLFTVLFALILAAACTGDPEPQRPGPEPASGATASETPTDAVTSSGTASEGTTIPIQLWFVTGGDRSAPRLFLHHENIPATQAVGRAALERLIRGVPGSLAQERNVFSIVPSDTRLLDLTIADGTATVDFSRDFEETGVGTLLDGYQIPQVVYTLTQFPTVKRVEFLLEGRSVEVLGGHGIILNGPQTRKEWEQALPPIVVERPYPDQRVGRTFEISGIANVFEATVSWRLTDTEGEPFKEGFVTATCGSGCWGTFEDRISLERVPGEKIVLEVFQSSAEDGSPLNLVKIPLNVETD